MISIKIFYFPKQRLRDQKCFGAGCYFFHYDHYIIYQRVNRESMI